MGQSWSLVLLLKEYSVANCYDFFSYFLVPIFAHEQGHLDAHPVLVGHSGYTQVTISGEPNSIVLMKATELYTKKRQVYGTENDFKNIMEDSIGKRNF